MAVGNPEVVAPLPIAGLKLGVAQAGVKYENRDDLAVVLLSSKAKVSGVFTQNAFAAAPVLLCREHLAKTQNQRAFVVNSGNANACTGESGMLNAKLTCDQLAELVGVESSQVLPFSTGVIGEPLPVSKMISALPVAIENAREDGWENFSKAIMTTDTRPKIASKELEWGGEKVRISGVAKGAGMIKPNMATMLAYIACDASINENILNEMSLYAAQKSFNRITIDGDTSTNDACILISTGHSIEINGKNHPFYPALLDAVVDVYQSLAKQIVMDGEGATKCVQVQVEGGGSPQESLDVAYAIAHSPLVKTALFASDPNWGRIVAAIGYAGIPDLDISCIQVFIDEVCIVDGGGKSSTYQEKRGQAVFDREEFCIRVVLGRGEYVECLWTSDLSHEYIRVNAEYRS